MKTPSVIRAVCVAGSATPERPSLIIHSSVGWEAISCSGVAAGMDRWARILLPFRPSGREAGQAVVVIVVRQGLDAYASFLGAMRAGLVPCFIPGPTAKQDSHLYWTSHQEVLARIAPVAVVAYTDILDDVRAILHADIPLLDAHQPPYPDVGPLPDLSDVDNDEVLAVLQHSSGTTGLKKGVMLTHGKLRRQIDAYSDALSMSDRDTVASWLPLYHDMGLITGFLLPLSIGSTVACMDPFEWLARPDSILAAIARFHASFCWLPNFAFAHLINTADGDAEYDLSSIRALIDCSEPCKADTLEAFERRFSRHGLRPGSVTACYAMAETVFAVTQGTPGLPTRVVSVDARRLADCSEALIAADAVEGIVKFVSCGRPIAGTSVRIVPTTSHLPAAPARPVGEIQVLSSSSFDGYFRNEAAYSACMDGSWFKTGDLGFLYEGELYVSGRLKDLIIVNGRNFYAHDIEAIASAVPGVKPGRAVAFAVERASAGSDGAVVVAETSPGDLDGRTLARAVGKAVFNRLGLTLHDVRIRQPGTLVKTSSGKMCRHENRQRYVAGLSA